MATLLAALLTVCSAAVAAPPPGVLRVGPGQPFATVGQALLAAAPGDLVLVDAGTYPAFVVTQAVTVAATQGSFVVALGTNAAAITILGAAGTVAIDGARIALDRPGSAAITASLCSGDVRLQNVQVDTLVDLPTTSTRAAIDIDRCGAAVLEQVEVRGAAPRRARTTNPEGGNDGVSAVRFVDTRFVLRGCVLRGYDAASGGTRGGDAVRVVASGALAPMSGWLLAEPTQSLLGGSAAVPGGRGGNCLHLLGTGMLAELCGLHFLVPGTGAARPGGFFALQDDGGEVVPGVLRMIPACVLDTVATTTAPATVAPGSTLPVTVDDTGGGAVCLAALSLSGGHRPNVPGIAGRVLLDPASAVTLGLGVTPATFGVAVPAGAGLEGVQLTAQALVIAPNGYAVTVSSWPAFVSVR